MLKNITVSIVSHYHGIMVKTLFNQLCLLHKCHCNGIYNIKYLRLLTFDTDNSLIEVITIVNKSPKGITMRSDIVMQNIFVF